MEITNMESVFERPGVEQIDLLARVLSSNGNSEYGHELIVLAYSPAQANNPHARAVREYFDAFCSKRLGLPTLDGLEGQLYS